ncbi:hypothetical protein L917_04287 [Phytophthora nicotianae]|uniref:Uncharacterized protein n=1 Tax=Phytophthora nicotianae TaxID=4792 RepID=W2HA21_PHYNI|nr:hypothetical protein L915_04446 [Phytophthora nicotianae]ETL98700.1 hypothetical protein L917_04287 [Phytophthora nicotianae]
MSASDGSFHYDPIFDVMHIAGKWFYIKKFANGVPVEDAPVQDVQSKHYFKKVMFLCAVGSKRSKCLGPREHNIYLRRPHQHLT